jgi:hypothetical protein
MVIGKRNQFSNLVKIQVTVHRTALRKRLNEWIEGDAKQHADEINRLFPQITIVKSRRARIDMGNFFPELTESTFILTIPQSTETLTFQFETTGPYDRSSGIAIRLTSDTQ